MIRKFLLNLLLFSIPIIVIAIVLEGYLRNRTEKNEVLSKLGLIDKFSDSELVFIGNSHGRNAFIPNQIDSKSINLCIGGSTIFYNSKLLAQTIDRLPNLKTIVYNLSYQSLYYDLDSLPDDKKKYEFHHYLGADAGVDKWSINYFSILSTLGLKKTIQNLRSDLNNSNTSLTITKGHKNEEGIIKSGNVNDYFKNRIGAHHQLMNSEMIDYNIAQLQKLEKQANERNIDIIYVFLPVALEYFDHIRPPFDKFEDRIAEVANNNGSQFYNLHDSLKLDHSHFIDPDHVNEKGAQAVSTKLANLMDAQIN